MKRSEALNVPGLHSPYGAADQRTDRLVYDLYGLTKKEIRIVEEEGQR